MNPQRLQLQEELKGENLSSVPVGDLWQLPRSCETRTQLQILKEKIMLVPSGARWTNIIVSWLDGHLDSGVLKRKWPIGDWNIVLPRHSRKLFSMEYLKPGSGSKQLWETVCHKVLCLQRKYQKHWDSNSSKWINSYTVNKSTICHIIGNAGFKAVLQMFLIALQLFSNKLLGTM